MSRKLISRSPDLQRLQDEGYEVAVRDGFLILTSIPYVNSRCEVAMGTLVTDLHLNNDQTQRPKDHQVWFGGEHPCNRDGSILSAIVHSTEDRTLCEGVKVHHRFSNKPPDGYPNYHAKMTRYVEVISHPAKAIAPSVDARTHHPIPATESESVFLYTDSASSRAGIVAMTAKLALRKVAIIGLGGTGSYVLDLVAKTPIGEIHLFDGDHFVQHNAFRAPGATSLEALDAKPTKVDRYVAIYSQMRRGVIPHAHFLDPETVSQLADFDFAFLCVDKPAVRKVVSDFLHDNKIPFVDVGMNLEIVEEQQNLIGTCRVTLSTPDKMDHFPRHVSLGDTGADDIYASNIQVADLNALNAALAVIKWKKHCGFYQDCYQEHQSAYSVNTHQLTRDEANGGMPV